MSLETVLSHPTVERVGWTLVHFLWQGAALTAMFGVELALLRKSRAGVRYLAGCLILALMVLAPCLTMFMMPASESRSAVEPEAIVSIPAGASSADYAGPPEVSALGGPNPALAPSRQVAPPTVTAGPARPWKERAVVAMEPALPYLVLIWLAGVFGLSVWHLGGWAQLQRLRRRMVRPVEDRLHTKLHELAQVLGVRRAVALMESALVQVPTVVGWLKPVILLPASALTGLTSEQLEAILAHELAHIRRLDYLVNMLQTLAEILGFYHPAVWWVSHKIRIERENCCDDLVIGVTGDKLRYARALTLLEEMRAGSANLAVAADGGSLLGRIRRLVGKGSREEGRYSWLPAAITVLLILAIAVPTTIALSTSENKKADVKVEAAWGQAADGVQARIWVDEHVWPENEVPRVLKLELRNRGTRKLGLAPNLSWAPTELEVDGHWYYNSETTMLSRAGPFAFGPQAELRDGSLPIRDSDWRSKKDDRTLKLMPGKRRIRVAFVAQPEDSGGPVRFVSNPVQIEILPVTAEAVEAEVSEVVKVIRLKYADPEDLSEHLNATFNEPGAGSATRLDEISNVTGRVRFIPNPRAKTILVLCPAESMGSIEEMIKEVDRPGPGIQVRKFSATLSNGVTVELVGICEHPSEEKQWWRPDGGILQERPYERLHDMEAYGDLRLFEVVYRVQPGKGVQSRIDRTEAIPGSFGPYPIERETEGVSEFAKDSLYAYVPVKDGLDRIDLPVLCGTERGWQWHARIESPVDHAGMNTDKVNLSARAGKGDRTIAFVTHRIFDEELRVIAKDKSGQIHKPVSDKRKAMTWAGSITAEFDLPVTEVASIEVQTQKFDKVVFGNVSLKPGAKT
ncbi:MAG: M56 family metallopeptidase, partial [Planctomycetota bacterium]